MAPLHRVVGEALLNWIGSVTSRALPIPFALIPVAGFFLTVTTFADANIAISGSLTRVHDVGEEGVSEGTLVITNTSNQPQRVEVDVADRTPGGRQPFVEAGSTPRSAYAFLAPTNDVLVLAPNERREWSYRIDVSEASQVDPGSYWSTFLFDPVGDAGSDESEQGNQDGFSIRTRTRYAVGVIVNVGSADTPRGSIRFGDVDLQRDADGSGELVATVDVSVDGPYVRTAAARLQIVDRSTGAEVLATPPRPVRLYPSHTTSQSFGLGRLSAGAYEVLIVAESGDDVYAIRFDLDVDS